ncbi:peptidoglycan/xylan/chitin deacetylase (PgdA/CDA1 family) [Cytobacillus horneckiae]
MNILTTYNVPATFFVLGERVAMYPELVKRMNKEGHDIGSHSFTHVNFAVADMETFEAEMEQSEELIEKTIGYRPRFFRPPYGNITLDQVIKLEESNNLIIGWNVDTLDWTGNNAEEINNIVLSNDGPGSIILFHDGGHYTQDINSPEALADLIPELQRQGYEFVTVSELLNIPKTK